MTLGLTTLIFLTAASGVWISRGPSVAEGGVHPKNWIVSLFEWFGELGMFSWRVLRSLFGPPYEFKELMRQVDTIGPLSLPLVVMAGGATGVVMALQTRDSLSRVGAKGLLPAVILFSLVKETGPIITGLVVAGRVGAGIGAELGSMRVTEQIDAMEVSGVDAYKYLAGTRVLACILMLPLLTVAADTAGLFMGWIAETLTEPMSLQLFLNVAFRSANFNDLIPPTLKTAVFGLIIGMVASFEGMRTRGGTEGVGLAATRSVVFGSLFIILADVVLVKLILAYFQ